MFLKSVQEKLHSAMMALSYMDNLDGLVQERRNSSALAMEFCLSCTNPSIWDRFLFTLGVNFMNMFHKDEVLYR